MFAPHNILTQGEACKVKAKRTFHPLWNYLVCSRSRILGLYHSRYLGLKGLSLTSDICLFVVLKAYKSDYIYIYVCVLYISTLIPCERPQVRSHIYNLTSVQCISLIIIDLQYNKLTGSKCLLFKIVFNYLSEQKLHFLKNNSETEKPHFSLCSPKNVKCKS